MKRIHKFLHLSSTNRRLLVKSLFLLGLIRLGLWLLPFGTLRRLLAKVTPATTTSVIADSTPVDTVAWAVGVTSRYVPQATCLAQALVAQVLLAQRGHLVLLRIGVALSEEGKLEAHAWVESQGKVVIGDSVDLSCYIPLTSLE